MSDQNFQQVNYVEDQPVNIPPRRLDGRQIARKTVGTEKLSSAIGTADISSNAVTSDKIATGAVTNSKLGSAAVTVSKVSYEEVTVTIGAGTSSGTGTVTSGAVILGYYPTTNQDQIVKSISISGTTLTITLLSNATAQNVIKVVLLKP